MTIAGYLKPSISLYDLLLPCLFISSGSHASIPYPALYRNFLSSSVYTLPENSYDLSLNLPLAVPDTSRNQDGVQL